MIKTTSKTTKIILGFLISVFSYKANAMFIEPYMGYEMSKMSFTSNSVEIPYAITNNNFGVRLGYSFLIPWVALDYSTGSGKFKFTGDLGLEDQTSTSSTLGVTGGVDIPLLRAWAGVITQDKVTSKNSTASNTLTGTGTKVGIGLKFIPFVSINIEYIMHKFTKGSGDSFTATDDIATALPGFSYGNSLVLGVSIPL